MCVGSTVECVDVCLYLCICTGVCVCARTHAFIYMYVYVESGDGRVDVCLYLTLFAQVKMLRQFMCVCVGTVFQKDGLHPYTGQVTNFLSSSVSTSRKW